MIVRTVTPAALSLLESLNDARIRANASEPHAGNVYARISSVLDDALTVALGGDAVAEAAAHEVADHLLDGASVAYVLAHMADVAPRDAVTTIVQCDEEAARFTENRDARDYWTGQATAARAALAALVVWSPPCWCGEAAFATAAAGIEPAHPVCHGHATDGYSPLVLDAPAAPVVAGTVAEPGIRFFANA